jgi:hypothetical protein
MLLCSGHFGLYLTFFQTCFCLGVFYDLARLFEYVACKRPPAASPEEALGVLLAQLNNWVRRFKSTPEQVEVALEAGCRGFEDRFRSKEAWVCYWWGGPTYAGNIARHFPSGFCFRHWIKTEPPCWKTAVALGVSRMHSETRRNDKDSLANRLYTNVMAVDEHYHGPRWHRYRIELDALDKGFNLEEARVQGVELARTVRRAPPSLSS